MSLNQFKLLSERNRNVHYEKLNNLLRLQGILQFYINESQKQNVNDNNDQYQQWLKLIREELQNIDSKEIKFSFFDLSQTSLSFNKKKMEEAKKLIEFYQKTISKLEIDELQNNLVQYFQNLLHNLYSCYENQINELKKEADEYNQHLRDIMIIKQQIETFTQIENLKQIKQALADHLLQYLENLNYKNWKLKSQFCVSKKSFLTILATAQPEKFKKLKEIIDLDEYLLNIIQNYPKRYRQNADFDTQNLNEIKSIAIQDEDFANKLSKQKGILQFLLYKQSIFEKMIDSQEQDLQVIMKEFGELFIDKAPSLQLIEKLKFAMENLKVDESLKIVNDDKFILSELRLEKEKYQNFISELRKIEDYNKSLKVCDCNKLIIQTESVIKTLEAFKQQDNDITKMLINQELMILKTIIKEQRNLLTSNYEKIIQEKVELGVNEKDQIK
ncbi:unnamed protein product [Paramecium pentaurelia]|uniref:Uncharacterized protein n=1 Tax=Paramecium pentaurelia TaxID=43138 RepID=A0A8S1VXF3_9CILI|nr:unnamed protein product [Paramecium pentaurelia]